jgi:hypothetical protein
MDPIVPTKPSAAPGAEPSAPAIPSAQNLTVRARANLMSQRRAEQTRATSAAQTQPPAPAAAQTSPASAPASREETPATADPATAPAPVLPAATAPDPASPTSPTATADGGEAIDPTAPEGLAADATETGDDTGTGADAALALLEGDPTEGSPDVQTSEDAFLQKLTELLQTGDARGVNKELLKRVHQTTDRFKTAEAKLAEVERRLAEQATAPEATNAATAGHPVLDELAGQIQQTLNSIELTERFLDDVARAQAAGDELPQHITLADGQVWSQNGKPVVVTPEQARQWKRQYESSLSQLNSRKVLTEAELTRQHRDATRSAMTEAVTAYPWLKNAKSAEYQEVQTLLRQRPGLKADPNWPVIVGDYIAGKRARELAAGKAKLTPTAPALTRPKGSPTPPPVGTQPGAVAASAPTGKAALQKQVQEAEKEYNASGSVKARSKLFSLRRQLVNAA